MSKKFNNKYLLILLAVLIALFIFVKFFRSARTERTLKTDIVQLDTSKVSKILLYPQTEKGQEVVFTKKGNDWKVSNGKIEVDPEKNSIRNLLAQLIEIKVKRLVSRSKDKWAEYLLTDTSATKIKVFEGEREKLNLYIGKFTYQQSQDPYSAYGGGGVIGTSYVRIADEDEIYAVDGFLTFVFNQAFNSWRNRAFIRLNKPDITRLTFRYPADSSFVLSLENKKWMVGNQLADSAKVSNYLGQLSLKNASTFDDAYTPVGNSTFQLTVEGNNMSNLTVDGFVKEDGTIEVNSSQNPGSWFTSDKKGLFKDIFKGKKEFLPSRKN